MALAARSATKAGYYDSVGGKVHAGSRMDISFNTGFLTTYGGDWFWLNMFRRCGGGSNPSTSPPPTSGPDANGYYDLTAVGSSCRYYFWFGLSDPESIMPNDNIVIRWTGTADDITIVGNDQGSKIFDGPTETTPVNKIVYSGIITGNMYLLVRGGTCTDIEIFEESYESNIDAGELIHPQFITDMAGLTTIRYMDSMDTNFSPKKTYAEYQQTYGYPHEKDYISMRGVAEISNATNTDPWICIPHQFTDAAVTDMLNDLDTYLDVGRKVRITYSNEVWNFTFSQWSWVTYLNNSVTDAVVTPSTASVASVAHGMATGDPIRLFEFEDGHEIWPYYLGAVHYVLKDTDDAFRLVDGALLVTAATQASTCVITFVAASGVSAGSRAIPVTGDTVEFQGINGMTELNGNVYTVTVNSTTELQLDGIDSSAFGAFTSSPNGYMCIVEAPINAAVTQIRYKTTVGGSGWTDSNYAARNVAIWAIADGIFTRDRVIAVAETQYGQSSSIETMYGVAGFRERLDIFTVAPYMDFIDFTGWETSTYAEITDWLFANGFPRTNGNLADDFVAFMAGVGHYRIGTYEGGDQTSFHAGSNETRWAKFYGYMHDEESSRALKGFFQAAADWGFPAFCHYKYANCSAEAFANNAYIWGPKDHTGDTTNPRWVGTKLLLDAGGASKS